MQVLLTGGRVISVPLIWFPILYETTPEQRARHEIGGGGVSLHWPDPDEDLSGSQPAGWCRLASSIASLRSKPRIEQIGDAWRFERAKVTGTLAPPVILSAGAAGAVREPPLRAPG